MTQHILTLNSYLLRPIEGLLDFLKSWNAYVVRTKQFNQTVKELSQLTDKELNDIGIARGDIYSIARGDKTMKRYAETNTNLNGWV